MTLKKTDSYTVIIRVIIALIAVTLVFFCVNLVKYGLEQYELGNYPLKYGDYVERFAGEYGLDKYLVYAVIKTESGFNPKAESNMGARGLMQIMTDTFDWIKMRLNDEGDYDGMYEVEQNIRYGCYLLYYNLDKYGDVDCALAAYHAGGGNVDSWLSDKSYSGDGKTLDRIPISDTAHYVDKVNKAYKTYIKLYEGD